MNGIQIVLLTGICLISLVFVRKTWSRGFNIVFLVLVAIIAVIFIFQPELTSRIARMMGVGRGTDLVFYISFLVFWYVIVHLFARIRKLEQMMTDVMRREALQSALKLPVNKPTDAG